MATDNTADHDQSSPVRIYSDLTSIYMNIWNSYIHQQDCWQHYRLWSEQCGQDPQYYHRNSAEYLEQVLYRSMTADNTADRDQSSLVRSYNVPTISQANMEHQIICWKHCRSQSEQSSHDQQYSHRYLAEISITTLIHWYDCCQHCSSWSEQSGQELQCLHKYLEQIWQPETLLITQQIMVRAVWPGAAVLSSIFFQIDRTIIEHKYNCQHNRSRSVQSSNDL